jgi:hypothetical protein
MAKPKTQPAPATRPDPDEEELAAQPTQTIEELGESEELDELLSELGGAAAEAKAIVYSVEPNKEREECMRCPLSVFSVEELRAQFGPGNYQVWVYFDRKLKQRINYRLKAPRVLPTSIQRTDASSSSPQGSDLDRMLTILDERQRRSMEPLLEMSKALVGALAGRPQGSSVDTLDQAIKLAGLLSTKGGGAKEAVDLLLQGMKLGQGREGGGSIWAGAVEKAIDKLSPLVDAITPAAAAAVGARAPAPANGATAPALEAPAPVPGENPMLQLLAWLQTRVREFIPLARAGKSPELYAEVILDQVPAGVTPQQLYQALKKEGAIDSLFSMLPSELRLQAVPLRPWFMALREELLEYFDADGNLTERAPEVEAPPNKGSDVVM